jgi:hypothetical protein
MSESLFHAGARGQARKSEIEKRYQEVSENLIENLISIISSRRKEYHLSELKLNERSGILFPLCPLNIRDLALRAAGNAKLLLEIVIHVVHYVGPCVSRTFSELF